MNILFNKYTENIYDLPQSSINTIWDITNSYLSKYSSEGSFSSEIPELSVLIPISQVYPLFKSKNEWDDKVYKMMEHLRYQLENKRKISLSLFSGLAYIGCIVKYYVNQTGFYLKFINSFDHLFVERVNAYLNSSNVSSSKVTTTTFDAISGLSGIAQYLFLITDIDTTSTLKIIANYLCKLTNYQIYKAHKVPGWFVHGENITTFLEKELYPNGQINYGMAHGITGVLAILLKLSQKNIQRHNVDLAINTILQEFEKVEYKSPSGVVYYPGMLDINDYINKNYYADNNERMSWCYGSVGILYILYLVYKYKNNYEKCNSILNSFDSIAIQGNSCWKLESPIICHGFAGTAHIFKLIYKERKSSFIKNAYEQLLNNIFQVYNPDYLYSFKDILWKKIDNKYQKISQDRNTFLEGGSGIISVLLGFLLDDDPISSILLLS